MSEDCVLVGMCSKFECNEKEMFRKLANSATDMQMCMSEEDCVLVGMCSEFECNEKEMFRKNSATALKNIVSVILLGLLFNKLF